MKTSLTPEPPRRPRRSEMVILFVVANQMFAIAAETVQEIRSTDSLAGAANEVVEPGFPKVRHTLERLGRTYYVVNATVHFGLPVSRPGLVLILRQQRVAVLVDRIERMTEIPSIYPLPRIFVGEERRWYRGLAYVDDLVVPIVHDSGFLTEEEFETLDTTSNLKTSQPETQGAIQA